MAVQVGKQDGGVEKEEWRLNDEEEEAEWSPDVIDAEAPIFQLTTLLLCWCSCLGIFFNLKGSSMIQTPVFNCSQPGDLSKSS